MARWLYRKTCTKYRSVSPRTMSRISNLRRVVHSRVVYIDQKKGLVYKVHTTPHKGDQDWGDQTGFELRLWKRVSRSSCRQVLNLPVDYIGDSKTTYLVYPKLETSSRKVSSRLSKLLGPDWDRVLDQLDDEMEEDSVAADVRAFCARMKLENPGLPQTPDSQKFLSSLAYLKFKYGLGDFAALRQWGLDVKGNLKLIDFGISSLY